MDVAAIIKEIKKLYTKDARPFAIGYSGGKDSSAVVNLVFEALLELKEEGAELNKAVYVIFSDTLLEMDPVIEYIHETLRKMETFSAIHGLPVKVLRAMPEVKESFWSLLIGKGYTLPRRDYRWCTDRMKIKPSNRIINKLLGDHGGFISFVGVRKDESPDRAARIEKREHEGITGEHEYPNCLMAMPIKDWSTDDVWNYLYKESLPFLDAGILGAIYSQAAGDGDECRSMLEGSAGERAGCSKSSRFGCMICPLAGEKDRTLSNLVRDYPYLKEIELFRQWLVSFQHENWSERDLYNHRDHTKKIYNIDNHRKNMVVPGGYTLEFRKEILKRLKETNDKIVARRGRDLISKEELVYIQECWIEEGDLDMSAEKIWGETLDISEYHRNILDGALDFKSVAFVRPEKESTRWFEPHYMSIPYFKGEINDRFAAQFSKQLIDRGLTPLYFALALYGKSDILPPKVVFDYLKDLPLFSKHYFPTSEEEAVVKKEWEEDEISFVTALEMHEDGILEKPIRNLFGFEGEYASVWEKIEEFNEKDGFIEECESISLEEKYLFFD